MVQTLMERSFTSMWVSQSETWHGHNWPVVGCDLSLYLRPCCQLSDRVIWATCHSMVSWYNYHFMKNIFNVSSFLHHALTVVEWIDNTELYQFEIFHSTTEIFSNWSLWDNNLKHSYWLSFKCIPILIHKTLFMKGSWELRDIFL